MNWRERRLIKDLYLNQTVKVRIKEELTEDIEIGRGVRQGLLNKELNKPVTSLV